LGDTQLLENRGEANVAVRKLSVKRGKKIYRKGHKERKIIPDGFRQVRGQNVALCAFAGSSF